MASNGFSPLLIISVLLYVWNWRIHVYCQSSSFVVTDFGATLDGKTDSATAFLNAWKKACQTNGGTLVIPGGTYFVSSAKFSGPCNGQTKVLLNGNVQAFPAAVPHLDYWIMFYSLKSLSVSGKGKFDGNGASFWAKRLVPSLTSIKFESVANALIQDISSVNSKMFHIGIHQCQHVTVNNVHISAAYNSPNTDGIHVGQSDDVRIIKANIATGDDCVSLGDGSSNINITGVSCGPGHGISIGSLGKYAGEKDVRSVTVTSCTLSNTTNGLRIKSFAPSPPSTASGITFQHIIMNNVENPIIIDQHYCPHSECTGQGESSVSIKSVKFIDVRGSSRTAVGVKILCSKSKPCEDIELEGVNLNFGGQPTTASCSSADVKFLGSNQVPSRCS